MDRWDFDRPHGFHVRYYDNALSYKVHNVIPYKTSSPNHLVYKVMRSIDKVNVWLTSDGIVAQLDIPGHSKYIQFPSSTCATEIVCTMLSQRRNLVVVDGDDLQPTLF
nr:MAG TPA: hypothetical protein [Caudoviricetes sp.]